MKNLAPFLAVPISEYVVTFISLEAAATLPSWTTGIDISLQINLEPVETIWTLGTEVLEM